MEQGCMAAHRVELRAQNAEGPTLDPQPLPPRWPIITASRQRLAIAVPCETPSWPPATVSKSALLQAGAESQVKTQTVTASFRPLDSLSITPTLGYRAEQQEWSGARMNSPSASLTMKYQQSQRLTLTAMGNYFGTRSSDKLVDLDMIGGKGSSRGTSNRFETGNRSPRKAAITYTSTD